MKMVEDLGMVERQEVGLMTHQRDYLIKARTDDFDGRRITRVLI
jgi:hypothetical protein